MSEISLKSISIQKGLIEPDESGMVFAQFDTTLIKGVKGKSLKDLQPTDEEMDLINEYAMVAQEKDNFLILRNVDPIGDPKAVDSQMDVFSRQAEKNLVEGAPGTPLLINHDHDISNPPVGYVLASKLTNKGPRETIAIPLDNGNDGVIKGMMNGSINKLSVGVQVFNADMLCNSCEKATSIYSMACPHTPGAKDEKGNVTTKTINKVSRYLERSLVNVPARMGTSTKALEEDPIYDDPIFEKGGLIADIASLEAPEAIETETLATISPVQQTTEENTVAEDQKPEEVVEVAPVAEPTPEPETAVPAEVEPAAVEPEAAVMEMKVSLSDESNEFIKAQSADVADKVSKLLEVVSKQEAMIAKQSEQLEASAKAIEALTELQKTLVEKVDAAVGVSTKDVLEKLVEVVNATAKVKADANTPVDMSITGSDFVKHLWS